MILIADYGVGNIFSLTSSFKFIGADAYLTNDPAELKKADKIILPGVGAFEDAAKKLKSSGMWDAIMEETAKGKPLLGICLGMQMLFERSFEYGEHQGLGLLKGQVVPMAGLIPESLKIPHMGWNALNITKPDGKLFRNTKAGDYVYFVHSYFATGCEDSLAARTEYGTWITAAVEKDNVFGCQFHPEKSGEVGLDILRAFCAV